MSISKASLIDQQLGHTDMADDSRLKSQLSPIHFATPDRGSDVYKTRVSTARTVQNQEAVGEEATKIKRRIADNYYEGPLNSGKDFLMMLCNLRAHLMFISTDFESSEVWIHFLGPLLGALMGDQGERWLDTLVAPSRAAAFNLFQQIHNSFVLYARITTNAMFRQAVLTAPDSGLAIVNPAPYLENRRIVGSFISLVQSASYQCSLMELGATPGPFSLILPQFKPRSTPSTPDANNPGYVTPAKRPAPTSPPNPVRPTDRRGRQQSVNNNPRPGLFSSPQQRTDTQQRRDNRGPATGQYASGSSFGGGAVTVSPTSSANNQGNNPGPNSPPGVTTNAGQQPASRRQTSSSQQRSGVLTWRGTGRFPLCFDIVSNPRGGRTHPLVHA